MTDNTSINPPPSKEASPLTTMATSQRRTILKRFPENLPDELNLILGQDGTAYGVFTDAGNPYALAVGSKQLSNIIRGKAREEGISLRQADIRDINHFLQAHAEIAGNRTNVWYRVAPNDGGIEIDMGDDNHTHIKITAGKVEVIKTGSKILFYRSPTALPMAMPTEVNA